MKRNIDMVEDDIAMSKRVIEMALYSDSDIIEILDNPTVDITCPEDIVYSSIFPFIRIPGTQDTSKNFITFSIDDMSPSERNDIIKHQYIQFVIFVHKDLVKTKYGIARHDLLGFLVRDIFNRSHLLGHELKLITDREGVTDNDYTTRTLRFELITPEVTQDCLFDNRYERFSLNAHDKRIVRESV